MITNEDILAALRFPVDPNNLIEYLSFNWPKDEVIEALQVAIERDVIMLNLFGFVVPHDGESFPYG